MSVHDDEVYIDDWENWDAGIPEDYMGIDQRGVIVSTHRAYGLERCEDCIYFKRDKRYGGRALMCHKKALAPVEFKRSPCIRTIFREVNSE